MNKYSIWKTGGIQRVIIVKQKGVRNQREKRGTLKYEMKKDKISWVVYNLNFGV